MGQGILYDLKHEYKSDMVSKYLPLTVSTFYFFANGILGKLDGIDTAEESPTFDVVGGDSGGDGEW